jgi:hypothetical protein
VHQLNTWRQAGQRDPAWIADQLRNHDGRYSRMRRKAASVAGQFDAVRKRGSSTSS